MMLKMKIPGSGVQHQSFKREKLGKSAALKQFATINPSKNLTRVFKTFNLGIFKECLEIIQ